MPVPLPAAEPAAPPGRTRRLAERTRTRYAEVHECLARGLSRSAVSRELNLDIQTVRRFANASCAEELLGKAEHRATKLDPFIDLVNQRWNEGMTNAEAIAAELRALGFRGDAQAVRRYLQPFRLPGTSRSHPDPRRRNAAPAAPAVPKPRTISKALLTHPDRLSEDDALIVKDATAGCAHLERLHQHVRSFAKIMAQRRGAELPAWLAAVEAASQMRAAPNPRTLTGWSGASSHVLRFPRRAFLRFPVCPPGSSPSSAFLWFPVVWRSPVRSLRPLPGSGSPSVSLRAPFPLSNLHNSAAARRFRRRRSRAAGSKVTSNAAPLARSRDPPALQMGSGRARWDAATESPVTSGRERRTPPPPEPPRSAAIALIARRAAVTCAKRGGPPRPRRER